MTTKTITGEIQHVGGVTSEIQSIVDGEILVEIKGKTALYAIIETDDTYFRCNGTFTMTLPASTGGGVVYIFKNIGVGVITISRTGTDLIDGLTSRTLIDQYDSIALCDSVSGVWDVM